MDNRDPDAVRIRSVAGLNDNLALLGRQLHVQTENLPAPAGCISTQVFCNGKVLLSRKTDYPPEIRAIADAGKIQALMRSQHLAVIAEITERAARACRDKIS